MGFYVVQVVSAVSEHEQASLFLTWMELAKAKGFDPPEEHVRHGVGALPFSSKRNYIRIELSKALMDELGIEPSSRKDIKTRMGFKSLTDFISEDQ